ncbi:MAG: hypothetical protein HYW48_06350 [Deltaproteobacteria bacterium]|nr:hypothetical protein [Deltaproteobacteria bacterium]
MTSSTFTARSMAVVSSVFMMLLALLRPVLGLCSSKARKFFEQHKWDQETLGKIRTLREGKTYSFLFFCSSAGEYEQAKPVLDRLSKRQDTFACIIFFSNSGYSFAQKRNESLPCLMSPLDTLGNWRKVFAAIRPTATIIIRHELWPAFLHTAARWGKIYLINGSLTSKKPLKLFLKKHLYSFVDTFFTVSDKETDLFVKELSLPIERVHSIGDTKYDRVWERTHNPQRPTMGINLWPSPLKLIVGSAWWKDCELALAAFWRCRNDHMPTLQLILAPHSPDMEFLHWLDEKCDETTFTWGHLSQLENPNSVDILIIDSVGVLFELYRACHFAFIGGALHYEVHNVLEPASFGLPIAFGPLYHNSHEAETLVANKLATVIHDEGEFFDWLRKAVKEGTDETLRNFIKNMTGASDRFLTFMWQGGGLE